MVLVCAALRVCVRVRVTVTELSLTAGLVWLCVQMGNYNMEPPALFRGRGEHPRTGALKKVCAARDNLRFHYI